MTTYVAVFAMVLAYVALVAAYFALRTLAKLRRATSALSRGSRGRRRTASLIEATEEQAAQTELLAEQLTQLRAYVDEACAAAVAEVRAQQADQSGALRNVALVRYDAFADMSGRMSFSLALLDDAGDGVAISAIAGRTDTRVYAKGVSGGKGEHELSPEEQQAITSALQKPGGGLLSRKAS
jgi:hypothetical protein